MHLYVSDYSLAKVEYLTGLSGNTKLLDMVDKPRRRAENDFKKALEMLHDSDSKDNVVIRRYVKLDYKAQSWKHEQRVIAKIEVSTKGTNIRFVVTKNRNNSPETIYKRYCKRGEMELWIKDVKYFKADRMSCNSYRANYFRLFLYAAAFVVALTMKHGLFNGTAIESFTMDSFITQLSQVNFWCSNSAYSCTNMACRCEFPQMAARISSL